MFLLFIIFLRVPLIQCRRSSSITKFHRVYILVTSQLCWPADQRLLSYRWFARTNHLASIRPLYTLYVNLFAPGDLHHYYCVPNITLNAKINLWGIYKILILCYLKESVVSSGHYCIISLFSVI
jgi:hypothetical protein